MFVRNTPHGPKINSGTVPESSSRLGTVPTSKELPSIIPLRSLSERYQLIQKLGSGSFGTVVLAKSQVEIDSIIPRNDPNYRNTLLDTTGGRGQNWSHIARSQRLVAVKTMMTRLQSLRDYERVREVKFILCVPANRHLIQVFEIFIDNVKLQLHIVMESMDQNLYQLMKNRRNNYFSIPSLKSILAQILAGIKHIHANNFFHRDIKPENILVSASNNYFEKEWLMQGHYEHNYVVKLVDFGLARGTYSRGQYTDYVSTRWYRSPEILLRNGFYSKPIDIWAFGCVAVEVANFKPLFPGSNEIDQIWKILQVLGTPIDILEDRDYTQSFNPPGGCWEHARKLAKDLDLEFPHVDGISVRSLLMSSQLRDLADIVELCLKWDPNKRPTAEVIATMPFFHGTLLQEDEEYEDENGESNADQALMFAGIKTKGEVNTREIIFYPGLKHSDVPLDTTNHSGGNIPKHENLGVSENTVHGNMQQWNRGIHDNPLRGQNMPTLTQNLENVIAHHSGGNCGAEMQLPGEEMDRIISDGMEDIEGEEMFKESKENIPFCDTAGGCSSLADSINSYLGQSIPGVNYADCDNNNVGTNDVSNEGYSLDFNFPQHGVGSSAEEFYIYQRDVYPETETKKRRQPLKPFDSIGRENDKRLNTLDMADKMAKKGDDNDNFLLYQDSSHTADMQPKTVTNDNSVDISFESGSFRDIGDRLFMADGYVRSPNIHANQMYHGGQGKHTDSGNFFGNVTF